MLHRNHTRGLSIVAVAGFLALMGPSSAVGQWQYQQNYGYNPFTNSQNIYTPPTTTYWYGTPTYHPYQGPNTIGTIMPQPQQQPSYAPVPNYNNYGNMKPAVRKY
jgi:hypothetical protein